MNVINFAFKKYVNQKKEGGSSLESKDVASGASVVDTYTTSSTKTVISTATVSTNTVIGHPKGLIPT